MQEALAEIDAGRGRYQEAIVRYERLQRRSGDTQYTRRLDEIKEQFAAANMPPQYQRAFESVSIDRADLAVLLYWKVASVRFAQNLAADRDRRGRGAGAGRNSSEPSPSASCRSTRSPAASGPRRNAAAATLSRLAAASRRPRRKLRPRSRRHRKILAACAIPDPALELPPDAPGHRPGRRRRTRNRWTRRSASES